MKISQSMIREKVEFFQDLAKRMAESLRSLMILIVILKLLPKADTDQQKITFQSDPPPIIERQLYCDCRAASCSSALTLRSMFLFGIYIFCKTAL